MLRKSFQFSAIYFRNYGRSSFIRAKSETLDKVLVDKPNKIKWDTIRNEIQLNEKTVNEFNIDSLILSKCFNGAQLDVALSYINFLQSKSLEINDASVSKLIRLYYKHFSAKREEFTKSQEDEILKWCKIIIDRHETLDASTAENIVHGLSLTHRWKDAFKYFDHIKMSGKELSDSVYSCILSKAIENDSYSIIWDLLNEMSENQVVPRSYVFIQWFNKHINDEDKVNEMLEYISDNHILLPEIDIQNFSDALKPKYTCSFVSINRNGRCPSCLQKLPGVKLLETEFNKIAAQFLEDIFIRNDVWLKTNPSEIKRFKEFIDKTKPYDSVIDGLNVAYSQGDKLSPKVYSKILAQVVKYFVDKKEKCLVIGRKHMKFWPKKEMSYVRENSMLFLTEDLSNDDLFLLYAALKSGPKTNIFSRDLMRQHSHLLSPKMKKVFRRWQQEHQYHLITAQQKVIVREPITFELRAHRVNSIWHLPFTNENIKNTVDTFILPACWLCLKRT
ncbi:hypothetical protein ACKWTF_008661 [Chironomus riparius]